MDNFNIHEVCKKNIWNFKQNKPSLIAKDLSRYGVPFDITMRVLLARGVFKWLGVRRLLIKQKDIWKNRLTNAYYLCQKNRKEQNFKDYWYYRGYAKAYEEARKEVRDLCHSERWQAPDFDYEAQNFLNKLED